MDLRKRAGLVLAMLAILVAIPLSVASAAPPGPFTGVWEADDNVDLISTMRLIVSGGGNGTYLLRWTDTYFSICGGGPGRGSGTGTVSGNVLSANMTFYCGSEVFSQPTGTFTLSGSTMTDSFQGATWTKVGGP